MPKAKIIPKDEWLIFSNNYLSLAELACREMLEHKYNKFDDNRSDPAFNTPDLFISTIYNIKHSAEIFIKNLRIILKGKLENKGHNTKELFKLLKKEINLNHIKKVIEKEFLNKEVKDQYLSAAYRETDFSETWLRSIEALIFKYQHCKFLKDKILDNYSIEDEDNTAFRYPENNLVIKLDYEKIISRINKDDTREILNDIYELKKGEDSTAPAEAGDYGANARLMSLKTCRFCKGPAVN